MAYENLQAVVGTAIVDSTFRRRLLNRSLEALKPFDLSSEEVDAIRSIHADTFEGFASALNRWIVDRAEARVPVLV